MYRIVIKCNPCYILMYFVVMDQIAFTIGQRRTPSPPCNPPSRILHIENLKRPFTVVQLKELLQEDGPLIDGGFWTNKIKSHCIAIVSCLAIK